jgi:hypothetical protein
MTKPPYKVGDQITIFSGNIEIAGVIECWRPANGRYRLTVKDHAGIIHMMWASAQTEHPTFTVECVDLDVAEAVARAHLAGSGLHIGVTDQLNILAAAYLQLRAKP